MIEDISVLYHASVFFFVTLILVAVLAQLRTNIPNKLVALALIFFSVSPVVAEIVWSFVPGHGFSVDDVIANYGGMGVACMLIFLLVIQIDKGFRD